MFPSRGLGNDVRLIPPDVVGAALAHPESAVHVALFTQGQRPDAAFVSRLSVRVRRLRQTWYS